MQDVWLNVRCCVSMMRTFMGISYSQFIMHVFYLAKNKVTEIQPLYIMQK